MNYIRNHWLGDQPLFRSFWINLILLRIVILYAERFTRPPYISEPQAAIAATAAFFIVCQLIVLPWQVVGVLRSCDRFLAGFRPIVWVWGIQAGIAASLILTLISVFSGFQSLYIDRRDMLEAARPKPAPIIKYTLTPVDGGRLIHLEGDFAPGITRDMEALLALRRDVEGIMLDSDGGRIYEGRGVAGLIMAHGLDTYVYETCKSACTTAFVAGATRTLGPNGRLGFHQYSLEAEFSSPLVDMAAEQEKDRRFFAGRNIGDDFLRKVFDTAHNDIWFPGNGELLAAGVIHRIADDKRQ